MSTICSAGHRRGVEEVNEAVLSPRVQLLSHTSLDVLFNTARKDSMAGALTVGAPAVPAAGGGGR